MGGGLFLNNLIILVGYFENFGNALCDGLVKIPQAVCAF